MTLPPGLQAVREQACSESPKEDRIAILCDLGRRTPALLDLIETLAGVLEEITPFKTSDLCDCEACRNRVRAALDKYREFK